MHAPILATSRPLSPLPVPGFGPRWLMRAIATRLQLYHHRYMSRRCLRELDPHLLDDIGRERREALAEASKPFWRA